jgi:ADP-ribose pyrophosphatase YjhB (NUDIX family)
MFCLRCGTKMTTRIPKGDGLTRDVCPACNYVYYDNPKVLVACILFHEDKVLWIKRATEPYAGRWAMPAGFVEKGETVEQAAARELFEGTRLRLSPDQLSIYSVASLPDINQIYISLIAPLPSMNFEMTPECGSIKLADESAIAMTDFAYPKGNEDAIRLLYKRVRGGHAMKVLAKFRNAGSPPI